MDQFQTPLLMQVGPGGGVVVIRTPVKSTSNSTEFLALVVSNDSCCGIRIELSIVLFRHPGLSGVPTAL